MYRAAECWEHSASNVLAVHTSKLDFSDILHSVRVAPPVFLYSNYLCKVVQICSPLRRSSFGSDFRNVTVTAVSLRLPELLLELLPEWCHVFVHKATLGPIKLALCIPVYVSIHSIYLVRVALIGCDIHALRLSSARFSRPQSLL